MITIDATYHRILQHGLGNPNAFATRSPRTISKLDTGPQDDILAIIQHLRTVRWHPGEYDVRAVAEHPIGFCAEDSRT